MKIHKSVYHRDEIVTPQYSYVLRKKLIYLCNFAVNSKKEKMSYRWNKVTCKNCLKHKKPDNSLNSEQNTGKFKESENSKERKE